jgi:hypothetical protein
MPIPVSATEQTTDAPSVPERGHPDLAALGELERVREEVAQDLRHLALVRAQERHVFGLLEHEGHRLVHEQRAQHAAQGGEEVPEIELRRPHDRLARLHRREVEQVVHQLGQVVGGLADIAHLPALLRGERALAVVEQERRQRPHRVQRRAELVAHVRQKARLELVGAPQRVRLLVELGVERDDAAVGVLELGVEAGQVLLALAELLERADQLLVLLADLLDRTLRRGLGQRAASARSAAASSSGARRENSLPTITVVPSPIDDVTSNRSTRRRAPAMPSPMPVCDRYRPERTASTSAIPGPRSLTRITRSCGARCPSTRNSTAPPRAYMKALRASSEMAVAMRVWSCPSKPTAAATWRAFWRTATTSCS